jgi:hypothetical protein
VKEKIGFVQGTQTDKLRVKDSWEEKFGDFTYIYYTEGVVGIGYNHTCERKHGDVTHSVTTQTSGRRLTREEIERLPQLAQFVSRYLPEVA